MKKYLVTAIVTGLMLLTLSNPALAKKSKGHKKDKVKYSDLDRANKAGEIRGSFDRCSGNSAGVFVYIVGRSFNALLTPDGQFTLSYVPPGTYSLAFVQNNHVLTTIDDIQVRKHKLTNLGEIGFCPDNDNDGFDESEDCNDNNPNINPDATEVCDGEDNNCDGAVDEGCPECTDGDNDGFFAQNGCGTAVDCNDHDATVNPNSLEVCDGVDNNCDGQTDEGCPLNCPTGTADCNNDRVDCETDITSDPANCGACGSACAQGQTCVNGACEGGAACTPHETQQLQSCLIGCDSAPDPLTCLQATCLGQVSGSCGQAVQLLGLCAVQSGCPVNNSSDIISLCVFQNCTTQWQDAFGDLQAGCSAGQTECNGQCVDLASDEANCGQCGSACQSGQSCNNGTCVTQCGPGQVQCNGQCVDNQSDPSHCGGCNVACRSGEVCNNGACESDNSCVPGTACNADSNGCTQDICDSSGTCVVGPQVSCDDGQACTQDSCVSTGNNTYHCEFQPNGNGTVCNGQCVDTNSDPANCGGCNVACGFGESCNNGACESDNCGGAPLNRSCGGGPNPGIGVCQSGTQSRICTNGQLSAWGVCIGSVDPQPETCDNLDNDCDGQVDEGTNGGSCNTGLPGICGQGAQVCTNGQITCQQTTPASPEICDNLDNNCDGQVDEGGVCQTIGNACQSSVDCGGGPCVDGVCCESSCSGICEACSQAKTGVPDGTCAPVSFGIDPDVECPGGACNGSGFCSVSDGGPCGSAADCLSGSCNNNVCGPATCPSGQSECNGVCVDVNTDNGNCGTCGLRCGSGFECLSGSCFRCLIPSQCAN